jgi:hypothetical protein
MQTTYILLWTVVVLLAAGKAQQPCVLVLDSLSNQTPVSLRTMPLLLLLTHVLLLMLLLQLLIPRSFTPALSTTAA